MSTVDFGAPVVATWAGAPAGGTWAVSITRPDGTVFTAPTPTGPPVTVTFVPDMAGRWRLRFTSTNPAGAYSDIVDVWPTDPRFIISLDDARNAINLPGSVPNNTLDDLRLYVAAATPVIEDIVGPIPDRTETQHVAKGWKVAALYHKVN